MLMYDEVEFLCEIIELVDSDADISIYPPGKCGSLIGQRQK